MSQLAHPNLVKFREIFEGPECYFVVMDLVTGGELFDRIIELQRYTEKDAVNVMYQALSGLKHMHDLHIAHRDLKPENLLLSSKDSNADIKIADFGFATKITDDTECLQLVGTPPYFAPELSLLRDENIMDGYGRPVDVWAMGVILYILLSGIHPFQIPDEDLMLDNIQSCKWQFVGPNWSRISKEAQNLIENMMTKDAKKRYTVDQCLEHRWMKGAAPAENLSPVADAIKELQAKKKLKGAIQAVLAQQKMKKLLMLRPAPVKLKTTKILIKVIQGKDLAAKDANGKSDPYINIIYGPTVFKTKHEKKTLNPVWTDQTFVLAQDQTIPQILFECWDWNLLGGPDFMGEFVVNYSQIPDDGTPLRKFFELGPATVKEKKKKTTEISGSIELQLSKAV